ncbi:MAG: hypothetical protein WCP09_01275 [Candidatus Taylorbacteria bacterium]
MNNEKIENSQDRIPAKEEVLKIVGRFAENFTILSELSDEWGIYSLEAKASGLENNESVIYDYSRKGRYADGHQSGATVIYAVSYNGDIPTGGETVAEIDEKTGEWVFN